MLLVSVETDPGAEALRNPLSLRAMLRLLPAPTPTPPLVFPRIWKEVVPALTPDPPAEVTTVSDLIGWLSAKGEEYAHAFEKASVIRAAIDKRHVKPETKIAGAAEIAFFPPMTGG